MSKEQAVQLEGTVIDIKPNMSIVETDQGHKVFATLSGKLRIHFIKIVVGDKVKLEVSPYDLTRGRITYRL